MSDSSSQNTTPPNANPGAPNVMSAAEALASAAAAMGSDTQAPQAAATQDPLADAQAELANVKFFNDSLPSFTAIVAGADQRPRQNALPSSDLPGSAAGSAAIA